MSWANTPIVPPPETMTKREAFAMAAMQGILSGEHCKKGDATKDAAESFFRRAAYQSVAIADALIAELEKQK